MKGKQRRQVEWKREKNECQMKEKRGGKARRKEGIRKWAQGEEIIEGGDG